MGRISKIDHDSGIVRTYRVEEASKCHLNDLVREIKSSQVIDTPIMPEGTVSYTQNGSIKIFFVQRPEALVPVQYRDRVYQIAWPIQVYGIIIDNLTPLEVCLYFAKKTVDHEFDEIFWSCLPNQHDTGRLCMGSGLAGDVAGASSYVEVIKRVIHWIRTASFNEDLSAYRSFVPRELQEMAGTSRPHIEDLFRVWERWTQNAGEEWPSVNRLSWTPKDRFNNIRGGFRS